MAVDPKRRQKQLARKAAKRTAAKKKMLAEGAGASKAKLLAVLASLPIHECLMPRGLFEVGIGNVVVSRKLPSGNLAVSFFLVDVHCLGVKFTFYEEMAEMQYQGMLNRLGEQEAFNSVSPPCAVKLVKDAVEYAQDIGFDPPPDYRVTKKIFGDIDPGQCPTEFTFGKDGKPFYVSGPKDTPAKRKKILDTLNKRFGPSEFDYIIQAEGVLLPDTDR